MPQRRHLQQPDPLQEHLLQYIQDTPLLQVQELRLQLQLFQAEICRVRAQHTQRMLQQVPTQGHPHIQGLHLLHHLQAVQQLAAAVLLQVLAQAVM